MRKPLQSLHFKGVIIYERSHNLLKNNDSPSHYISREILTGESLLTVTAAMFLVVDLTLMYIWSQYDSPKT